MQSIWPLNFELWIRTWSWGEAIKPTPVWTVADLKSQTMSVWAKRTRHGRNLKSHGYSCLVQSELLIHIKPEIALNSDGEGPLIACGSYSVMHHNEYWNWSKLGFLWLKLLHLHTYMCVQYQSAVINTVEVVVKLQNYPIFKIASYNYPYHCKDKVCDSQWWSVPFDKILVHTCCEEQPSVSKIELLNWFYPDKKRVTQR